MIFNKIAIVNLMGGLGNQLHQIAFSKYLDDIDIKKLTLLGMMLPTLRWNNKKKS